MLRYLCGHCDRKLRVPVALVGIDVACPYCGGSTRVPGVPLAGQPEPENGPLRTAGAAATAAAVGGAIEPALSSESAHPSAEEARTAIVVAEPEPESELPLSSPPPEIDPEELIDMTAMVDIVFFLLIFFLVTSMTSLNSSMPIPVPKENAAGAGGKPLDDLDADLDLVVVRISPENALEVEGIPVATLEDLTFQLKQLRASGPTGLLVVGSSDASHGAAVSVLDAGHTAGFDRVQLSVTEESGP